jgi:hypothetical protein
VYDEYESLLAKQLYKCAICKSAEPHSPKKSLNFFLVDHNHHTGKVRGLSCFNCNTGLGKFNDSVEILEVAINYLYKGNI